MPRPMPVVKIHLGIKPVIYAAVVAEAEATGFSVTEIINRVLYDAGYGRAAAKAAIATAKPEEPESDDPAIILAKTPFPYIGPDVTANEFRDLHAKMHEIMDARVATGIKSSPQEQKRYQRLLESESNAGFSFRKQ